MALKTKVKVGNITNLSDARYCAGMGVDMLGFPFNTLDFKTYQDITGWVAGPQFVIEIPSESTDIHAIADQYAPDFIEIEPQHIATLPQGEQKYIIRLPLAAFTSAEADLLMKQDVIEYVLLTESTGDTDKDRTLLESISQNFKALIGYNITEDNLSQVMSWPVAGISLKGSDELKPGLKDYDHLATILELLED